MSIIQWDQQTVNSAIWITGPNLSYSVSNSSKVLRSLGKSILSLKYLHSNIFWLTLHGCTINPHSIWNSIATGERFCKYQWSCDALKSGKSDQLDGLAVRQSRGLRGRWKIGRPAKGYPSMDIYHTSKANHRRLANMRFLMTSSMSNGMSPCSWFPVLGSICLLDLPPSTMIAAWFWYDKLLDTQAWKTTDIERLCSLDQDRQEWQAALIIMRTSCLFLVNSCYH